MIAVPLVPNKSAVEFAFVPLTFSMSASTPALLLLLTCVLALWNQLRRRYKLPPGPARRLFSDNRRDIPPTQPWKTFTDWHQKYGDVIVFYLGNTPVIVLGTHKAASDLLEKRGNIYSSRPRNIIAGEILSRGMQGIAMPYGTQWRNWRRLMHSTMNSEASHKYKPLQLMESSILLRDLLTETDQTKYTSHLRRFSMSVMMFAAYGRRISSLDDPIVAANLKADEYFINAQVPGRHTVESWPVLLYLPRILQWFRREPENQRAADVALYMSLMNNARRRVQQGMAQHSMAKLAFEKQTLLEHSDVETAYALSAPSMAGVGPTLATFQVFIMAMLHYPDVMRKVQTELDSIVGTDRLPEYGDAESLPYLQAVIKETRRWCPVLPIGVAHAVITDDAYEGMYIPKGSTVYANIYAMSKDPNIFPDPNEFRPERFLDGTDPMFTKFTLSFGIGRRFCPGMHIAQQSLFILISRILWAFDIAPMKDETGKLVLPSPDDLTTGLVSQPKPFHYSLNPRRADTIHVIMEDAQHAAVDINSYL